MKKVLLLIILLPLLFSCRTAKDLEKNTEIKEIIKERHDTLTVHTRDSIYFSVIQKGDTVYNVAKRYGLSPGEVMRANGISDPSRVQMGQVLKIIVKR